jgi:hypothetical protein
VLVLTEFLELWDIISGTPPQQDTHVWQWFSSDKYTTKSAYDALRQGSVHGGGYGKHGHLKNVGSYFGWQPTTDVGQQID